MIDKRTNNRLSRGLAAVLGAVLLLSVVLGGFTRGAEARNASDGGSVVSGAVSAAGEQLSGKSAAEIVDMMGIGFNIGNTFDADGGYGITHESSWGNPKITRELIHALKEAGFSVIRLPITWNQEIDASRGYKINEAFMNRVREVVDWCYEEGLFVIINTHHETWLERKTLDKDYRKVGEELKAVWEQIADAFAEYDQHLIFEGMNEPRMKGSVVEWTGSKDAYKAINYLAQVFAETIRGNGKGYNGERCMMIPAYAASSSTNIMETLSLPSYEGKVVSNLIASVHCYAPYDFCLKDTQMTFGSADEASVEAIFKAIRSVFLDNGIPVVIGETSATEKENTEERVKWATRMGSLSQAYGMPIVIWDNGVNSRKGGESHAYIDRRTCELNYPTVVKALFDGAKSTKRGSALKDDGGESGGNTGIAGTSLWSDANGKVPAKEWDHTYISMGAKATWFGEGRSFAIVYTGSGEPKMILDSETKQKWWIPVEPTRYETKGDRKVIWYDYDTIKTTLEGFGITDPSDLRNFMIIATTTDVKTYEVIVTGETQVTYMVNGQRYAVGSKLPEEPKLPDWVFVGWYLSKTYDEEFTAETKLEGDAVVYAMLRLKTDEEIAAEITPTPEPTATPVPTATTAPTVTTAPTPEPEATKAPAETSESQKDNHPSSTGWTIIIIVAVIALVIVCAVIMRLVNKRGGKQE